MPTIQANISKFLYHHYMNTELTFADILKDAMIDRNLNQSQTARLIGVKPNQVSEWLAGKSVPNYFSLKLICKGLGISGDEILGLK